MDFHMKKFLRILTSLNKLFSLPKSKNVEFNVSKSGEGNSVEVSEEHMHDSALSKTWTFDPDSGTVLKWNKVFLCACLVALFIDPLYLFVPKMVRRVDDSHCVAIDLWLSNLVTCVKTAVDVFYWIHMYVKFRTGYLLPTSCIVGRGELVVEPRRIAIRYMKSSFFIDLIATLPLPQIFIWFVILGSTKDFDYQNNVFALLVLLQYLPRLYIIFPLIHLIIRASGVVTKTTWAGASYITLLYLLISHVIGAAWYLLALGRFTTCLKSVCKLESAPVRCVPIYLHCTAIHHADRMAWTNRTHVFNSCNPGNQIDFQYGIFEYAVSKNVLSSGFAVKYFYGLWFGVQNLSSFGQNLATSTYIWETTFSILIGLTGLIQFARLIGDIQTFMRSSTLRGQHWRVKRRETEEWMEYRQLPGDTRERVRRYVKLNWLATRGVNEEAILRSLPADLQRDIQRHLCLDIVGSVPLFAQMDDQLLEGICECLIPSLIINGTYTIREGDLVTEMIFIIRGKLESSDSTSHLSSFLNPMILSPGDFCGEELLDWALQSKSSLNLPLSTRTVKAITEVEAFALRAEDLRYVANQFRSFTSRKLRHTFQFYCHSWRTRAACVIQAAWRRSKSQKMGNSLWEMHPFISSTSLEIEQELVRAYDEFSPGSTSSHAKIDIGDAVLSLAANPRKGIHRMKPEEPDFSMKIEDE